MIVVDGEVGGEGPAGACWRGSSPTSCASTMSFFSRRSSNIRATRAGRGCASSHARRTRSRIPTFLRTCRAAAQNDKAGFVPLPRPLQRGDQADPRRFQCRSSSSRGEAAYPIGQFFEASPDMNILLYPTPVKFKRRHKLPAAKFQLSRRLRAQGKAVPGAEVRQAQ